MRTTFGDAIVHLVDYLGGSPSDAVQRDCRRAILEAYRDLANAHRWTYLLRQGRVITSPPFNVGGPGTIAYDSAANRVTLSGAAWPAWAAQGYLRSAGAFDGTVLYRVARRIDDATLALDDELNPGVDLPPGTAASLHRDTYLLPADYVGNDQTLYEQAFASMTFVHPHDWAFGNRYDFSEGAVRDFTITGDPAFPGRLVMRVNPFPTEARSIDFLYHRRPRPLVISARTGGAVALAAGSATATFTGASLLLPDLAGVVFRASPTAVRPPTSVVGDNPPLLEATVLDAPTTTTLLLDAPSPATVAGMPYVLSDPIDIEDGAMLNAFWRCCEMHLSIGRTLKDKPSAAPLYKAALAEAKQADSRSFAGRAVGDRVAVRRRLRDYPIDLSVTE